nr:MAG TPA: antirepressor protein [Caudoviricetes sp.]
MSDSQNGTSVLPYNGTNITFELANGDVMVNLTDVAKAFPSKNLSQIINSKEIKEYVDRLAAIRNYIASDLLKVENGVGTWAHQKIALRVAQKLSPDFAIWVDTRLEELITTGVTIVNNDDEVIARAMAVLQSRLEANKQQLQMARGTIEQQQEEIKQLQPKADYTDEVLQSTSTFTATQIAKEFGMSAVTLNTKLRQLGVQFYQSGQWMLTAKYQGKGYTDMRIAKYVDSRTDEVKTSQSLVWTERGRLFISTLSKEGKI